MIRKQTLAFEGVVYCHRCKALIRKRRKGERYTSILCKQCEKKCYCCGGPLITNRESQRRTCQYCNCQASRASKSKYLKRKCKRCGYRPKAWEVLRGGVCFVCLQLCSYCGQVLNRDNQRDKRCCCLYCDAKQSQRRRKQNPYHKIRCRIHNALRASLGRNFFYRTKLNPLSLLSDSIEEIWEHLKTTIPPGYTEDDFLAGKLQIDHIRTQKELGYPMPDEPNFKICWAKENLRLLTLEENAKRNRKGR